jgi:dihydrofolate reductase
MKILTRMCMSLDGYVTTPDGWPVQMADPGFSPDAYGFSDFQKALDAVRWPWGDLDVFVLGSQRPDGTPDNVVIEGDPATLLERIRAANKGGDVHLVGGPKTVEAFRAIGALDQLGLIVLPLFVGSGMQMTPDVTSDIGLTLNSQSVLPSGVVELVYDCD